MKGEYNNIDPHENHHHNHNHNHNHPFFTKYAPHQSNAMVGAGEQSRISDPIPISSKKPKTNTITTPHDDGATVEVTRRPRGRPPGSKNKPKPPIVINREPEPSMSPYILEVQSGSDIIHSLTRFTRRREMGICVLNASGSVANVTLKQPSTTSNHTGGGTVTFHGRFDILSLSAVLLTDTVPFLSNNNNEGFGFSITLGGPQGQIFGGKVVEPLIAVTTVYVIATSFNCHNYQRLPGAEDEGERVMENISGGGGGGDGNSGSPVSGCGSGGHYGCHVGPSGGGGVGVGADVMWGPTSRTPLPPY